VILKAILSAATLAASISYLSGDAQAWEATYNQRVTQPLQQLGKELKKSPNLQPFSPQNVEYPADGGAQLGQGWDLFLNTKVDSTCVEFKAQRDKYETAEFTYKEATDEETRDVTLNMTFKIAGGASTVAYGDYKGNSSLTKNSFARYYSKDVLLVGHASITNGAIFAVPNTVPNAADNGATGERDGPPAATTPQNANGAEHSAAFKAIRLLPGLGELLLKRPDDFRRKCGDGFVASINFGADLYSLLTIHVQDEKTREQLETAVETSGGYAGFFASGSGSISSIVNEDKNKAVTTIELVQRGGKISKLPVDLDTLKEKMKALPAEAWDGPRPTYMVIYPYSYLPEFRGSVRAYSTTLQAALRYHRRLQSIHSEILDMVSDYERDRPASPLDCSKGPPDTDTYYFSYCHRMRPEHLGPLRETIEKEIGRTSDLINLLSHCPKGCNSDPQLQKALLELISNNPPPPIVDLLAVLSGKVHEDTNKEDTDETEFDDLKYWIQLPLPISAIPADVRKKVDNPDISYEDKVTTFARHLYRHWVARQDAARCALYYECLSQKEKGNYYAEILKTFYPKQADPLITDVQIKKNEWRLTVQPCTKILVTNGRSAQYSNAFSVVRNNATGGSETVIPRHLGENSANYIILPLNHKEELEVQAWYFSGLFDHLDQPMWNSTSHTLHSLGTELWFQDPGSNAGGPPNLAIDFNAIPDLGPGCQ